MHTFFALEDRYGLKISQIDGELCLRLNKFGNADYKTLFEMLYGWQQISEKLASGEISKEEYDRWRYHYPRFAEVPGREKLLSQELSDMLIQAMDQEEK